jgi:hypothetical protein
MTEISAGQMKLLHVLAKQSGISHDELSASARKSYRVSSLKDLSWEQAGEMIDGLMPAEAKPVAPPKPQHYQVSAAALHRPKAGGHGAAAASRSAASRHRAGAPSVRRKAADQSAGTEAGGEA